MTRSIICNLFKVNLGLSEEDMEILTSVLVNLEEPLSSIPDKAKTNVDEVLDAIQTMFSKQIHVLNPELIPLARNIINADDIDEFLEYILEYAEIERRLSVEYSDRDEFYQIIRRHNTLYKQWIEEFELYNNY